MIDRIQYYLYPFEILFVLCLIGIPCVGLYFTVMGRLNSWLLNINKRQEEEALATTKNAMTHERAEKIVYGSADFLADRYPRIKDERLLPFPKERIIAAFDYRIEFFKEIRDADPAAFAESPEAEDLRDIESLILHFLNFGPIDPEDQQKVDEINADNDLYDDISNRYKQGETTEQENAWRSDAIRLMMKYNIRKPGPLDIGEASRSESAE